MTSIEAKNGSCIALSTALECENVAPFRETLVASCTQTVDQVKQDSLFVCLNDSDYEQVCRDVHDACARGALAAVVNSALENDLCHRFDDVCQNSLFQVIYVDDPRSVFARACQAFCDFPAKSMKTVAVTGTSGKTSLCYIIGGALAQAGMKVGLVCSLGVYDGVTLSPTKETTPQPEELAPLLLRMKEAGCAAVIIETTAVALAEKRLAGVEFDAVCMTNLRRDRLDYFKTVDKYRRVSMQIFNYLKPDGIAICNVDDRVTDAALHLISNPTLTVGIQPTACSVYGTPVESNNGEQSFYIAAGSEAALVRVNIIGKEHIYNCLEATALGLAWGIDLQTLVKGVERVEYIPGRMEKIDSEQPLCVYLDRANSAETLESTLVTLKKTTTNGKLFCVLCPPSDADRGKRPLMARTAELHSNTLVLTYGNNPASQTQDAVNDLITGLERPKQAQIILERKEAIVWALSHANPDDVVLIVGQDVSTLDEVNEKFVPDRQFIKDWLLENQPASEKYWDN
ncbi:MAG: UDP-N-acetylmuramyl-tripeptide synthetase [Planctomycetia bacterium]|nr:UDP-N-acetylmuramyl-tripeptide synthetase [Planctomycetia bacterium]